MLVLSYFLIQRMPQDCDSFVQRCQAGVWPDSCAHLRAEEFTNLFHCFLDSSRGQCLYVNVKINGCLY